MKRRKEGSELPEFTEPENPEKVLLGERERKQWELDFDRPPATKHGRRRSPLIHPEKRKTQQTNKNRKRAPRDPGLSEMNPGHFQEPMFPRSCPLALSGRSLLSCLPHPLRAFARTMIPSHLHSSHKYLMGFYLKACALGWIYLYSNRLSNRLSNR